eukprot:TRINITY_DN67331_c10_g3_i1.p1 TRINITY_DN67331_c10_g3~~TRINITY_DN67331_c10_g3_i1.p1  ORF type:complete len:425 (+),score=30.49 TRINITY_DN67331_c10_g3_i1:148-1275(+)
MGTYCQAPLPKWTPLPTGWKLKQVHLVHRHGDRTPVSVLPWLPATTWNCTLSDLQTTLSPYVHVQNTFNITHPRNAPMKGNCLPGQLTPKGFRQGVNLGKSVRQHYVHDMKFLPSGYPGMNDAKVFTASSHRCLQTAEGVLDGLWPGVTNISIEQFSTQEDFSAPLDVVCKGPLIRQWMHQADSSAKMKQFLNTTLNPYRNGVEKQWGQPPFGFYTFYDVWDTFACAKCHGQPMPPLITNDWLSNVGLILKAYWAIEDNYAKVHKYNAAPFLAEMLPFFTSLDTSMDAPKWVQWGVHDSTIEEILIAFGSYPKKPWVGYASNYIVEVAEDDKGALMVRRIYNGKTEAGGWNTLQSFITLLEAAVPKDWRSVCFGN